MKQLGFIVFGVALVLAVAELLVATVSVLLLIFAGVLYGIFLNGLSHWIARYTPLSYLWAFAALILLQIGLAAGGAYYLGATVAQQASKFSQRLTSASASATEYLEQHGISTKQMQNLAAQGSTALSKLTNVAQAGLWGFTGLIVIFFVGAYTAFEPNLYVDGVIKLVPLERRRRIADVLQQIRTALSRWILGRIASMLIIGVITGIALLLIGVPMAFTLAVLAALLTFVPNIGPILAAIPQALLALQVGVNAVLWVVALNIALQGVETYLITPVIQRYQVSLPPALVIAVQLIFGVTFGVIGLMMAAPLTVAVIILLQMLWIQDRLKDPQFEVGLGQS